MNMAGFYDESISNGVGWRAVLFVSGCPHNCPGCHNKVAQDYNYGEKFDKEKIINRICENSILKGITISGGEPLCKENIPEVLDFIKDVKKVRPNFNVWCYTGYTLEQLEDRNDSVTDEIARRYLEQLKKEEVDTLILGCTHYPLIRSTIRNIMGEGIQLVNPAYETAVSLRRILEWKDLTTEEHGNVKSQQYDFYVSDDPEKFQQFANSILPFEINKPQQINIEEF